MYGTSSASSGSTIRVPVNGGAGRSSKLDLLAVGARLGERQQRPAQLLGVLLAQPRLELAVLAVDASARRVGSRRPETTSTTRLASSTCTVSCEYAGAIFTAVCWREVVAPPIRSGTAMPRRSISAATSTIWSSDGVIRPERPIDVGALLDGRVEDPLGRHHHAEVDDLVVVAAEHDPDDVLADVVHVALDRGEQRPSPGALPPAFSSSMYGSR